MSVVTRSVLFLGGPAAGKTTLLAQLHGRLRSGDGALKEREAPDDLALLRSGLNRLSDGLPVEHTPQGAEGTQRLPASTRELAHVDILVPEYDGERVRQAVRDRALPAGWRDLARSTTDWFVLVRVAQQLDLPDVMSRPLADLVEMPQVPTQATYDEDLPVDLFSVELLQMLLHDSSRGHRGFHRSPRLTVVLTCWDEFDDEGSPREVAEVRLPLLASYVANNWHAEFCRFVGVSAQGKALYKDDPDEDFIDQGPQKMGYFVEVNGDRTSDLTSLVQW